MVFTEAFRGIVNYSRILARTSCRGVQFSIEQRGLHNILHKSFVHSFPNSFPVEHSSNWSNRRHIFYSKFGGLLLVLGAYSFSWYLFPARVKADSGVGVSEQLEEATEVEEPTTQVRFPTWLEVEENGLLKRQRLLGAGPRFMTPLRVKVYAVGVYVDEKEARSILSGFKYTDPEQLESDGRFWSTFSTPRSDPGEGRKGFGKTFRLVCIREVAGKHMQNGFDRGLLKRVREAEKKMNMPDGKQALKKFNGFFLEKGTMAVGCELLFVCSANGTVDTWIDGVHYGQVKNDALCWALSDMFLGMKPVSKEIKQQVSQGCFSWLQES
ncbi:hypothetical protein GpartN1_g6725.t1 [Galdieria partita]|uniref:Chalcone isomerase domain-containing protein n=1 Tax=Galdieria partita TaxID=83374 RepID=A0A9C7UT73_9RHOD|nr:hypothetical protein GpartN1_g6725.t1 [Galdieria partita]